MKKKTAAVLLCSVLLFLLAGCRYPYDEDQFLGKTSAEIVSAFGAFDCILAPAGDDGVYRSCRCGYTVKEAQAGFFGSSPEILFFISFDENGVAVSCEEGYRPGG